MKSGVLCRSSSALLGTRGTLESKSRQQLFEQQDITVICTIHFHPSSSSSFLACNSRLRSAIRRHHPPQRAVLSQIWLTPGCMKTTSVHQHQETPTKTDTQEHVYQKPMRDVYELKQRLIETWSATSRASLIKRLISGKIMRVS